MAKLNISGYRGIWGKDLNEQIAFEYGRGFARLVKNYGGKKILIGRDARKTGSLILDAFKQAIIKEGLEFEYAGLIPTPSMLFLVKKLSFDGGIMITASHNPPEYNGLKFIDKRGLFTTEEENKAIENNRENNRSSLKEEFSPSEQMEAEVDNKQFRQMHIEQVLKNLDVEAIRNKKFKVAHDPINSTGSIITRELLGELGCEVFQINGEPNGEFAHMPEPIPKNLTQLSEAVQKNKADVGFAQDPDADRLVIADETGEILSEEFTLTLSLKNILDKEKPKEGAIVMNLSTSRASEELASGYGLKTYRTKIGEPFVVDEMLKRNALAGGEGNGGIIYPKISTVRDSLAGIGLVLELMARENKPLSEIADSLPKYFMKKDKITFGGDLGVLYEKLKTEFKDASLDTVDGVRFDWPDFAWVHIRPSNTEPIVRIFGEAKTQDRIEGLFERVKLTLNPQ